MYSAMTIAKIGPGARRAFSDLKRSLEDPECDTPYDLLDALVRVAPGDPGVRDVLVRESRHGDAERRKAATKILDRLERLESRDTAR